MSYDRAITVFSPDGHLFQVEYALEAVKRGSTILGLVTATSVILAVERRATPKLQDARCIRKIVKIDANTMLAFAGLTADARVLINKVRVESQSYALQMEDAPTPEYLARFLARTQQKYTQRGGVRPFGLTNLLGGFNSAGVPKVYMTDPAGTYSSWKANALGGKNSKGVRELLEKSWVSNMTEEEGIKLSVRSLLEVVDSGSGNTEIIVMSLVDGKTVVRNVDDEEIEGVVKIVEEEIEAKKIEDLKKGVVAAEVQ